LFDTAIAALLKGKPMGQVMHHAELDRIDIMESDLTITFTQIASCIVGAEFIEHRRLSLRAKLERERYEREQLRQHSFSHTFRNLFGLARNQG
jgi:hypothetical protein